MVGDDAFCDPLVPASCIKGQAVQNGNGVKTGNCVESLHPIPGKPHTNYTCEIEAWCPVEYDSTECDALFSYFNGSFEPLADSKDPFFAKLKISPSWWRTLFSSPSLVKQGGLTSVSHANRSIYRRNILDSVNNETYLKSCHYSVDSDPYCPVFQLGYIAKQSNVNFLHIAEQVDDNHGSRDTIWMELVQGGVIGVTIKWECNLDFDIEYCRPQYSFSRLDSDDVKVAVGWNFRLGENAADVAKNNALSSAFPRNIGRTARSAEICTKHSAFCSCSPCKELLASSAPCHSQSISAPVWLCSGWLVSLTLLFRARKFHWWNETG